MEHGSWDEQCDVRRRAEQGGSSNGGGAVARVHIYFVENK